MLKKYKILIYLFSLAVFLHIGFSLFKIITTFAPDFNVFYYTAWDVLHGLDPYNDSKLATGFGYPVVTTFVYLPFTLLPYKIAQGLFVILNALSVPLIVWLSLKLIQKKISLNVVILVTALTYLSFPVKFTLGMGQSGLLVSLLLLIAFYLRETKQKIKSGLLLGIAVLMKPILGFILLFFFLKKEWKIIITAGFFILFLTTLSLIIFGVDKYVFYLTSVLPQLIKPVGREIYYNQGIMGFVSRLTGNIFLKGITSIFLSLVFLSLLLRETLKPKDNRLLFALFLITLVLIDTLSWQHHFVLLIYPFIYATYSSIKQKKKENLWLIGLAYLLVSGNIGNPVVFDFFPLSLILSHVFYGSVILFFVLLSIDRFQNKRYHDISYGNKN